jgi:hypothetical protein
VVERNGDLNLKVVPHLRNIVKLRLRFGCDVIGWDVCAFILSRMCKIRHTLSNAHVPGNFHHFIPSFRAALEVIFIDLVWWAQASKLSG